MKKYIFILVLLIMCQSAYSIDQATINLLRQKGLNVIMGELTGAGSKVSLLKLHGFVLNDGILLKDNCESIVVKNASSQDIASIIRVTFENQTIDASEFVGVIVKN